MSAAAPEPATRPQPGTPLPWALGEQWPTVADAYNDGAFEWCSPHALPDPFNGEPVACVGRVLNGGTTGLPGSIETSLVNAIYLVYAANELPKREARIERLEAALMLVTDGPASRRALSTKEARAVAEHALKEATEPVAAPPDGGA